jgi:hypothetical protein
MLLKILLSPSDRWQLCRSGHFQQCPFSFPRSKRNKEPPTRLPHFSDNEMSSLAILSSSRERLRCHALKAASELFLDILSRRREYFGHWPIVAEQVDDKGGAQGIVYSHHSRRDAGPSMDRYRS